MLEFMYVYFDNSGNIKAITPIKEAYNETYFSMAMLPLSEVEGFLSGKKNPSDFLIEKKDLPLSNIFSFSCLKVSIFTFSFVKN